jgi:microcompartment protein CcmL/EutN
MSYLSHHELHQSRNSTSLRFSAAQPALAMLEFSSVARGMLAADAMVKRAQVKLIHAGTVQPGNYLVLLGGEVAEVEEALGAGKSVGASTLEDFIWLPGVHVDVLNVLSAEDQAPAVNAQPQAVDAIGIIETRTAPAAVHAGDIAIKGAQIQLLSIRLADGLGGKGLTLLCGQVSDVEAAVDLVKKQVADTLLVETIIISQLHIDMLVNIFSNTRFFRKQKR